MKSSSSRITSLIEEAINSCPTSIDSTYFIIRAAFYEAQSNFETEKVREEKTVYEREKVERLLNRIHEILKGKLKNWEENHDTDIFLFKLAEEEE